MSPIRYLICLVRPSGVREDDLGRFDGPLLPPSEAIATILLPFLKLYNIFYRIFTCPRSVNRFSKEVIKKSRDSLQVMPELLQHIVEPPWIDGFDHDPEENGRCSEARSAPPAATY